MGPPQGSHAVGFVDPHKKESPGMRARALSFPAGLITKYVAPDSYSGAHQASLVECMAPGRTYVGRRWPDLSRARRRPGACLRLLVHQRRGTRRGGAAEPYARYGLGKQ